MKEDTSCSPEFRPLVDALKSTGLPVYHFFAHRQPERYIVWGEDGQAGALAASGHIQGRAISGTVDLFTKTEYDPAAGAIENAMDAAGIPPALSTVQYEGPETGFIHYEWVWEICRS